MEPDRMRHLFTDARVARLATVTPSLEPHVVPLTFSVVGDIVYSAVDRKPKSTRQLARLRNVVAHPTVSLLVDHYDDDWSSLWWVRVDGMARVIRDGDEFDAAIDALAEKYEPYVKERPDGPVIAVDITRWRGWSAEG